MPKGLARTFGQDLMRGEHQVGAPSNGGVLMPSHTSGDPGFYARAAAWLLGIDRFDDAKFEALEEELRVAAEDEARPVDQRGLSPTTAPVRRSDWLGRRDKWF